MFRVTFRKFIPLCCDVTCSRYSFTIKRPLSISYLLRAKLFRDHENDHCYRIIGTLQPQNLKIPPLPMLPQTAKEVTSDAIFTSTLNDHFRTKSATEIVATFKLVLPYCKQHGITIADPRFNKLVDGLMDNAEKLSDSELLTLLDALYEFPQCDSIHAHNYHDLWSCLDDMCCWRVPRWSYDMLFAVSERWFNLNLGKQCDFVFEAVDKMSRKPEKRLSKQQLVNAFFLMNITRKRPVQFDFEHAVLKRLYEFTIDELAIIALGYFKTQSKIKIAQIMTQMLQKAKETEDIHEVTLCAILKAVRFTSSPYVADQMIDFLNHITPHLSKYSTLCVLHASLLGTTLQIEHRPSLKIAAQRIASNIEDVQEVRLKDVERLLLALTMVDYNPETTPCIYEVAMKELHEDRRRPEMSKYPKCLGCALSYLTIRNMYSKELMTRVLDPEYVNEVYDKSAKMFPRELFVLDTNIDIEVDGYQGPRLDTVKRRKVAKWLTAFTPSKDQPKKISAAEKLILNVHDVVKEIVNGESNMFVDHVLPQYMRSDIIICRDKSSKRFVRPTGFEDYVLGEIMRPKNTATLDYFAIVIVGWNNTIRNTPKPVGLINMKLRHLRSIGFKPLTVIWNEFLNVSEEEKRKYIEKKLEESENIS